jgi:hypothetical protein
MVVPGITLKPQPGDILVTWNRIREGDVAARAFEREGLPVLVAENATWGGEFQGERWYTLARGFHNMAGRFPVGDSDRWDRLGCELADWRTGGETVVLLQRGLGPREVAMPRGWTWPGRVRSHPGNRQGLDLRLDLDRAGLVVTWGSGAAVLALIWGIPVVSHMPNWIAAQKNTDADRLRMFRELAWAQFTLDEIQSGWAFERLLCAS